VLTAADPGEAPMAAGWVHCGNKLLCLSGLCYIKASPPVVNTHHTSRHQGAEVMSKGESTRKEGKKVAATSPKEKKAAKMLKKAEKQFSDSISSN